MGQDFFEVLRHRTNLLAAEACRQRSAKSRSRNASFCYKASAAGSRVVVLPFFCCHAFVPALAESFRAQRPRGWPLRCGGWPTSDSPVRPEVAEFPPVI